MEARGKLFESIEARTASPVEKAQTLLRLATGGILTEGAAVRPGAGIDPGLSVQARLPHRLYGGIQAKDGEPRPTARR